MDTIENDVENLLGIADIEVGYSQVLAALIEYCNELYEKGYRDGVDSTNIV